ncbi:hypothetical protein NPIL_276761 [Nephila pilipes]|uniref:Uncharacterized protein n=1 Tax=Nephila pilipes TaxID=299642 RepID=A0A8X6PE92_NEPPI|nr:hypothetical protein NPIL_276761 [Nephila pilipes]
MLNLARTVFVSHQNPLRKEFQNEQLKQSGESSIATALVNLQKPGREGKIRTVKLKKLHGIVLRPIQRSYLLEIYSKESVDRELGEEESSSNNVTDNENNVTSADL